MFRFTIRDVLWLTVVVAMASGWAVYAVRTIGLHERVAELTAENEHMREFIGLEYDAVKLTDTGWWTIPKERPAEPNP